LKDIYFKSDEKAMQTEIASSILSRITDEEHSVRVYIFKYLSNNRNFR
jgi:hypothetical protein